MKLASSRRPQKAARVEKIARVPPTREIRVDLQLIYDRLQHELGEEGGAGELPETTKLVESIVSYELFDESRVLKQYFYYLSAGARKVAPDADWFREADVSPASLDAAEEKFLDQLVRLLLLARYKPLSNTEWLVSIALPGTRMRLPQAPRYNRIA